MTFHWWHILVAFGVIWVSGWLAGIVCILFFDPDTAGKPKPEDWWGRVAASCVINWFLWPFLLPGFLDKRKLHRDMQTGRRPSWIVLDRTKDEQSGRRWTLSDGTVFTGSASHVALSSSKPAEVSGDYEDDALTWPVEYRVSMIAPTAQPPSDWARLKFAARGPEPDPDDEDAVDDYVSSRYVASVRLARGKYAVEFRVPNGSGKPEDCSGVILIVSDPEDYNL